MSFGNNMKRLLQNKGVTQEQLGEIAAQGLGTRMVEEKYGAKVYSIITEKDIQQFLEN